MTENLDLAQLRTTIQAAQSAPSAGLVMKLIQELEEARARHRKAWGRAEAADAAIQRVREVHTPHNAVMNPGSHHERLVKVCTGCGTDDGNWQIHPCPTVRALDGGEQS